MTVNDRKWPRQGKLLLNSLWENFLRKSIFVRFARVCLQLNASHAMNPARFEILIILTKNQQKLTHSPSPFCSGDLESGLSFTCVPEWHEFDEFCEIFLWLFAAETKVLSWPFWYAFRGWNKKITILSCEILTSTLAELDIAYTAGNRPPVFTESIRQRES